MKRNYQIHVARAPAPIGEGDDLDLDYVMSWLQIQSNLINKQNLIKKFTNERLWIIHEKLNLFGIVWSAFIVLGGTYLERFNDSERNFMESCDRHAIDFLRLKFKSSKYKQPDKYHSARVRWTKTLIRKLMINEFSRCVSSPGMIKIWW